MQIIGHITGANLRALSVEQHSDWVVELKIKNANGVNDFTVGLMSAVGHIQSRHIHPSIGQIFQHFQRVCRRANGANYFSLAHIISWSVAILCKGISQLWGVSPATSCSW